MTSQTHQGTEGDPEVVPEGDVPELTVVALVAVALTPWASVTVTLIVEKPTRVGVHVNFERFTVKQPAGRPVYA
jgi:hypothetical protein